MPRILHLISQRPARTGSGVTMDALVRFAAGAGWEQCAMIGIPAAESPALPPLSDDRLHPVRFGNGGDLPFPVVGMSDVMPYESTVWSSLSPGQVSGYCDVWRARLREVVEGFQPDMIHSHHVWLLSAMVKDVAPELPQVVHCHATGLRQMKLCPHLADQVQRGCARADAFSILHGEHRSELHRALRTDASMHEVGAGYNDAIFHDRGRDLGCAGQLLFVGKFAKAKGLPWLLDAVSGMGQGVHLHVAGGGTGEEAAGLLARMAAMPQVTVHGLDNQPDLSDLMRRCAVTVLPSFYEGLPLVLAEAAACGNRLVATDLAGMKVLAAHLGEHIHLVPRPSLRTVDEPEEGEAGAFVERLRGAMEQALAAPVGGAPPGLAHFTWDAVAGRVERIWKGLLARP